MDREILTNVRPCAGRLAQTAKLRNRQRDKCRNAVNVYVGKSDKKREKRMKFCARD